MKLIRFSLVWLVVMVLSSPALATLYMWKDEKGHHHLSDKPDKLPSKFQDLLKGEKKSSLDRDGLGYWVDEGGNYHFYDKRGIEFSAPRAAGSQPQVALAASPDTGSEWRGPPRPLVLEARVMEIISADTILLDSGQKLKYVGIAFPEHLKGETPIHQEVVEYQRKMLQGKNVHILFDRAREDDKGRLMGFVFLGTDIFVNADLVLSGYARVRTIPPNLEYRELFTRLEGFARENSLGIWPILEKEYGFTP